jgi:hypothetical protein
MSRGVHERVGVALKRKLGGVALKRKLGGVALPLGCSLRRRLRPEAPVLQGGCGCVQGVMQRRQRCHVCGEVDAPV